MPSTLSDFAVTRPAQRKVTRKARTQPSTSTKRKPPKPEQLERHAAAMRARRGPGERGKAALNGIGRRQATLKGWETRRERAELQAEQEEYKELK